MLGSQTRNADYADQAVCQQRLAHFRWPDGVTCVECGSRRVSYLENRRRWQCRSRHPRRQFSVKVGTIFEDSPLGLDTWFAAIRLIATADSGVSSYEMSRVLGVTQKTAWFMLHRIRLALQADEGRALDGGNGSNDAAFTALLTRLARVPKARLEEREQKERRARPPRRPAKARRIVPVAAPKRSSS